MSAERWIGLIDPLGFEVEYEGYERQQVFSSDWRIVYEGDTILTVVTNVELSFPRVRGMQQAVSAAGWWETPALGETLYVWELDEPTVLRVGDRIVFARGKLRLWGERQDAACGGDARD